MVRKKLLYGTVNMMFGAFISFSFVYALTTALHIPWSWIQVFAISLVTMSIFSISFFNVLSTKISLTAYALALIAGVLYTFNDKKLIPQLTAYYNWLPDYINDKAESVLAYQNLTVLLMGILISLGIYWVAVKKLRFFILGITGFTLFIMQWSMGYFESYTAFYVFIVLILAAYMKHIFLKHMHKENKDDIHPSMFTLYALPICIIILLLSSSIPTSKKPVVWDWMDKKVMVIMRLIDNGYGTKVFDRFSLASMGFSDENGVLGGKLKINRTPVLEVESLPGIYLRGATNDYYTGTAWQNNPRILNTVTQHDFVNSDDVINPLIADVKEYLQLENVLGKTEDLNVDKPTEENQATYAKKHSVKVKFKNIRTKSIFLPLKASALQIESNKANALKIDDDGILSFQKSKRKDFSYAFDVYNIDYKNKRLISLLRKSTPTVYDTLLRNNTIHNSEEVSDSVIVQSDPTDVTVLQSFETLDNQQQTLNEYDPQLIDYLDLMDYENNQKYLQLPDTLPQRVRDLALSLTEKKLNNYDKVKALEQYLSSSFNYSIDVPDTPEGMDFVDYFLFDLKKGYCSYYATSLAVMVRSLGIPARYVEGYVLPSKPTKAKKYIITNNQAHAWVEVYFDGFGWVPFEPTASYTATFYNNLLFREGDLVDGEFNSGLEDFQERYFPGYLEGIPDSGDIEIATRRSFNPTKLILMVVAVMMLLLLCTTIFNTIKAKLKNHSIQKLDHRNSILAMYRYYFKVLDVQGLGIATGETPSQYSLRIDKYMYFAPISFQNVTDKYVLARFSKEEISEQDKNMVLHFKEHLIFESKINVGRIKFMFFKYILGRF